MIGQKCTEVKESKYNCSFAHMHNVVFVQSVPMITTVELKDLPRSHWHGPNENSLKDDCGVGSYHVSTWITSIVECRVFIFSTHLESSCRQLITFMGVCAKAGWRLTECLSAQHYFVLVLLLLPLGQEAELVVHTNINLPCIIQVFHSS